MSRGSTDESAAAGQGQGPISFQRMQRVSPLTIGAVYKQGSNVGQGYVLNLSRGGVFLSTKADFALGETFRLRFFLPFQLGQVDAEVVVRWRTRDVPNPPAGAREGLGVEFVQIEEETQDKIERFLQRFLELAEKLEED